MLMKLFKHEWKYFWKVPAVINISLIVMSLIGIGFLASPLWSLDYEFIDVFIMLGTMIFYVGIFSGSLGLIIYTAVRYYKNVYTDEGYLTNTLPVTARQIVLSKLFVSTIWNFITSIIIVICSYVLVYFSLISYGDMDFSYELSIFWDEFLAMGNGSDWFVFVLSLIFCLIISPFFNITMLYSSIALGQLFKKHKVAGAVAWYMGEYMIIQIATTLIMNVPLFAALTAIENSDISMLAILNPLMYGTDILMLVMTVILYFIAEYMLKKKLNLD